MNKNFKHRIVIIEPSPVVRQGLKVLLDVKNDFDIKHAYSDINNFTEKCPDDFDIILINPTILSLNRRFSARNLLSNYIDKTIIAIVYNHIDSYTLNSFDGAIDIYEEPDLISKKIKKAVEASNRNHEDNSSDNVDLSDREKDILGSVAKGLTNKEIADRYNISIHTVVSHRKNITRKTGIKTVSGLTLYAVFNNILSEEDI